MGRVEVGIRALRQHLSEYIRLATEGNESITITDRGRPVARIVPAHQDDLSDVWRLVDLKKATWSGELSRPPERRPSIGMSVADLIIEDRR